MAGTLPVRKDPPRQEQSDHGRKTPKRPIAGIRILDLTRLYPGPLGTMMLADMGADVIKIEDMNAPDYMRYYPPCIESESAGFVAVNRSKRSLALNLKVPKGVGIFLSLVRSADIVIEQFRPGVLTELGIGVPLKFSETPAEPAWPSPALGQDTKSILEEIGCRPEEIAALCQEGMILIPA